MEPSRANRRYLIAETPLSTRDYDIPVGWWGWNWDPPVPMSITEIVRAGNMDARTAALCGLAIAAHGSLLIAAEHPHSGKTTTLTALPDYLPTAARRLAPSAFGRWPHRRAHSTRYIRRGERHARARARVAACAAR